MVQLTPSQGTVEPAMALGNQVVDSGALTEDSISKPEIPDAAMLATSPPGGFAEPPPVFTPDPGGESGENRLPDDPAMGDQGAAPPPGWHSQKTAKSRKIAMTVAVVLASVISASILFSVFVRGRSGGIAKEDQNSVAPDADPLKVALEGDTDDQVPEDPMMEDTSTAPEPNDASQSPAAIESDVDVDLVDVDDPTKVVVPENAPPATDPLVPPDDLFSNNPLLPANPLEGLMPLDDAPLNNGDSATPDAPTMKELPKALDDLFIGLKGFDRPQFNNAAPAPKTIDEIQLDRAAKPDVDMEVAIDQPDPVNMIQALGLPTAMQAADPDGYPMNDLLLVLSQLSGVPVEVEWVSFEIVGFPIERRVKLPNPKDWPTIEDALTTICEANGATFDTNQQSITIRPTDPRLNQAVQSMLDFGDLPGDSASAVSLARLLLGQTDGDPSSVATSEDLASNQLSVLVCEAIRRIRGVPGKLSDESFARWGGRFQDQVTAWPELDSGVSGAPRIQPASFVSLVRQIAKLNGATCYINWDDGAKKDLQPTEKLLPRTGEGVSAAVALRQILQPAGLHVRVVDPRHWWIGSQASFDRFPVVVWFAESENGTSVAKQLELILRGVAINDNIIGTVAVDPATQTCVAILPRYLMRQLPRLLEESP